MPIEQQARRVRIGYALGSVATGSFATVPGLLLLPYLTDTLGIAAGAAGAIVLLPKALDVLLNPVAGRISDHHQSPLGPRRPFLLRAGLALAICFALLFAAPDLGSKALNATWVLLAFLACATAYAFFQVPYVAMPAEITDDYTERTRLMSWRVAFLTVAILVSGGASPAIRDAIGGRDGYRVMGLTVALLLAIGTVGAYLGTRRAPIGRPQEATGTLRDQLRVVARVRDFRWLLITLMLQALAIGSMLAGIDYLARYVLRDPGAASIGFVCVVGPALLVSPLWLAFGNRFGKRTGFLTASIVLGLGALALTTASKCRIGACTPPSVWSGSASPVPRCSRSRCCPTSRPWTRPAAGFAGPASSPGSGRPAKPWASRSAPACTPWCSRSAATCRRPTGPQCSRDRR